MKACITETDSGELTQRDFPCSLRRRVVSASDMVDFPDAKSPTQTLSPHQTRREYLNPFCVSQVQPGAIPFLFEPDYLRKLELNDPIEYQRCFYESMGQGLEGRTGIGLLYLLGKLEEYGYCAQISGPHGGGKSTLMLELATILKQSNHSVFYYSLHDHQRWFPREFHCAISSWLDSEPPVGKRIVFLDGFEQLYWFHRVGFRYFCKARQLGVLLSTHSPVLGLPSLYRTATSRRTLGLILEYLLDESDFCVDENQIDELFNRYRGDIRSVLFDLYDEYERQRIFN